MAVATKAPGAPTRNSSFFRSSIGQKYVMAVTGLIMLGYVVVHMLGNLKIFFGATDFNDYAHWLRTIGEPALHHGWFLWAFRVVLLASLVLHVWAAASLSKRDVQARPVGYQARRKKGYAPSVMRWGGVTLFLFIVYHVLDLTTGTLNPAGGDTEPYDRVVAGFDVWYVVLIYTLAMIALCLHIGHGLWSAGTTLGINTALRAGFRTFSVVFAVVIAAGFLLIPYSVVFGLVS